MKILEVVLSPFKALIKFLNKLMGSEKKVKQMTGSLLKTKQLGSSGTVLLSTRPQPEDYSKKKKTAPRKRKYNRRPKQNTKG